MKDAYYFSHDSNSRFDPRIIKLRAKFGLEGYGFYFCILEIMRDASDYMLNIDDVDIISYQIQIEQSKAKAMLDFCCDIGLFSLNNDKIFSFSFLERMKEMNELRQKRVDAGRKGGKAKAMLEHSHDEAVALKETKLKETKEKEIKTTTSSGYEFYINNINLMPSPYESEEVINTINEYTDEWFINACKAAINQGSDKRRLSYIKGILRKSKEKGTGVTESKKQSYEERRAHAEKMEREAGLL